MTTERFGFWLQARLRTREMNAAELARRLGVRSGVVSHWVNNKRLPTAESCFKLADVLDLPISQVLQAAGHPIEEEPDGDREMEDELVTIWRKLSNDGQRATLAFAKFQRGNERREAIP